MTEPTSTAPRADASSADSTPNDNHQPAWRQLLASKILAALPITLGGNYIADLTAQIVAIVVDAVGVADEVLRELHDALDRERARHSETFALLGEANIRGDRAERERESTQRHLTRELAAHSELRTRFVDLGDAHIQANAALRSAHEDLHATTLARDELRKLLDLQLATHDQLIRDYNERCTEHHATRIELERCRDELQTRTLQLHNMEKLVTAKEGN